MNKPMTTVPKQKEGHASDHFQTPAYAVAPLLKYIKEYIKGFVWECAAGDGNIVNFLNKNSLGCFGTDIKDGIDFLEYELHSLPAFDMIVTNPPYSLKTEFVAKCYHIGKPFALLMPITIEGKLCRMFAGYGAEFIIPFQRIAFITPSGRSGKTSSPQMKTIWVTHGLNIGRDVTYVDLADYGYPDYIYA